MKRLLLTLLLTGIAFPVFGQLNLDKMPEEQRNKILLEIAKKVMLEYAPDYYNENPTPAIEDRGIYDGTHYPEKNGAHIYSVKYFYDKTKIEQDRNLASMNIDIWADDGQPDCIINAGGIVFSLYGWKKNLEARQRGETFPYPPSEKPFYKFRAPYPGFIELPFSDEVRNQIRVYMYYLREDGSPDALEELRRWEEKMIDLEKRNRQVLRRIEADRLSEQRMREGQKTYDERSRVFRDEIKRQEAILNEQLKEQYPVDSTRRRKIREELKPQWDEFIRQETLIYQELERQNKQAYEELELLNKQE